MKIYLQKIVPIIISLFLLSSAYGQHQSLKEHKVSMTSGTIEIYGVDEIIIEGYAGSEVVFSTYVDDPEESERSMGLRVLNSGGLDDNTGLGVSVNKNGSTLSVDQINTNCDCAELKVMVPHGINILFQHRNHNGESILIKNIRSEVEITTNYHDIELDNVTGPMAIKTVYGKIEGNFTSLSQKGSISIYSVYDLVDITIPKNAKADLTVNTPYGNVYSNADIDITMQRSKSNNSCGSGEGGAIEGTLNGGGVDLSIKSSYEDVYLRQ